MKSLNELYNLVDDLRKKELYDEADQIEIKAQDLYISKAKTVKRKNKTEEDYTEK